MHEPYVAALCREIAGRGGILAAKAHSVDSVFFGGGTPTCLTADQITKILACIKNSFQLTDNAEISLEANPGTIDERNLSALLDAGINRLSIGVQSFDNTLLRTIGRIHNSADAERSFLFARQSGFSNINIDLMHGLPGQTLEMYKDSLAKAVGLGADHISAYSLIVEEETVLAVRLDKGELYLPSEETDAIMFDFTHEYLINQGYEHYEISNYAKPGRRCKHNLTYWRYQPYLGFGAAACSFDGSVRTTNTSDICAYIEAINNNLPSPAEREELTTETMMAEYIFLALRTTDGLSAGDFANRFLVDFHAYYEKVLTNLTREGLVSTTNETVKLTTRGMRFGNRVFAAFLPDC